MTAEMDPTELVPVRHYCNSTKTQCVVTTPATKPFAFVDHGIEGYIYKKANSDTRPLLLFSDLATGEYVTATFNPDVARFGKGIVVGHVMKVEIP